MPHVNAEVTYNVKKSWYIKPVIIIFAYWIRLTEYLLNSGIKIERVNNAIR